MPPRGTSGTRGYGRGGARSAGGDKSAKPSKLTPEQAAQYKEVAKSGINFARSSFGKREFYTYDFSIHPYPAPDLTDAEKLKFRTQWEAANRDGFPDGVMLADKDSFNFRTERQKELTTYHQFSSTNAYATFVDTICTFPSLTFWLKPFFCELARRASRASLWNWQPSCMT